MPKRTAAAVAEPDLLTKVLPEKPSNAPMPPVKPTRGKRPDTPEPKREVAKLQTAVSSGSLLAVISRAAANPNVDSAKMREILDMQKEIVAEEARLTFTRCYRAMRREMPVIGRDGKIIVKEKGTGKEIQSTPFSTYENLMIVCEPIFDRHGFSFMSAVEPTVDGTRINIVSWLDHDDGFQRVSRFPLPADTTGSKNNTQGWGSSSSYGKRYNAILLLNIISRYKQDGDNNGYSQEQVVESDAVETLSEEQVDQLNRAIMDCGVPFGQFCKSHKIDKLEQLPVAELPDALKRCAEYKARTAGARK